MYDVDLSPTPWPPSVAEEADHYADPDLDSLEEAAADVIALAALRDAMDATDRAVAA